MTHSAPVPSSLPTIPLLEVLHSRCRIIPPSFSTMTHGTLGAPTGRILQQDSASNHTDHTSSGTREGETSGLRAGVGRVRGVGSGIRAVGVTGGRCSLDLDAVVGGGQGLRRAARRHSGSDDTAGGRGSLAATPSRPGRLGAPGSGGPTYAIVSHTPPSLSVRGVSFVFLTYQTRCYQDIPKFPTNSSTDRGSNRLCSRSPKVPNHRGPRDRRVRIRCLRPNRADPRVDHRVHHRSDPSPRGRRWSWYSRS